MRSASVDFPWSMWAMIEKLRMIWAGLLTRGEGRAGRGGEEGGMKTVSLGELEVEQAGSEGDPTLRTRDGYLLHAGHGTTASSAVLFEVDPGCHIGRHFHTAEETVLVLEGSVEVTVGDETAVVQRGGVAFAPALVWHNVR